MMKRQTLIHFQSNFNNIHCRFVQYCEILQSITLMLLFKFMMNFIRKFLVSAMIRRPNQLQLIKFGSYNFIYQFLFLTNINNKQLLHKQKVKRT